MITKQQIDSFFSNKTIAFIGLSSDPKHFSRLVYDNLNSKGFDLLPVNPKYSEIAGKKAFPDAKSVRQYTDTAIVITPKREAGSIADQIIESEFKNLWFQQMSDTPEAVAKSLKAGINVINGKCLMMFTEPVSGAHKFHRTILKIFGKLPK